MPLSELYRMAKRKLDSNQDFEPENDLFELVWEKGQVMMQGQSSRPRKGPSYSSLPSHSLPSYNPRSRDTDVGNGSTGKTGKFENIDSVFSELPTSVPSDEIDMNQDEDMMPWLNYPIDDTFQQEYCPDFMPELSSVTVNEQTTTSNVLPMDRSRCNPLCRNSSTNSVHDASKVTSVGHAEVTRPRIGGSQLYPFSSHQCESSFPSLRSGASDIIDGKARSSANHVLSHDLACVPSAARSPCSKMLNQDPLPPRSSSSIINFSHFSRPVALLKSNLENADASVTMRTDLPSEERIANTGKDTSASNNPPESEAIIASKDSLQQNSSQCQVVASGVDLIPMEARHSKEPCAANQSLTVCHDNASKNDTKSYRVPCGSAIRGPQDTEKALEPVVASSSVCSGNSVERTSDDPTRDLKRKGRDTEESECHSEDAEEESVGVKKRAPSRSTGSKRSRAAEVHNLSERRRRDRINEKMRALQELIPNCNKVDKASMLDEAIEYLKSLQLQVQIMSMGTGLYMPPFMLPTGMQHMHASHMSHFSPMGVGMGMGLGMGYGMYMPDMNCGSSYPMIQVPPMQGTPFPRPPISGHNVLHGMTGSNLQVYGIPGGPGPGLPMQMQCAPLHPVMGGPFVKSSIGPNACVIGGSMENVESALPSTSKDPMQNIIPLMDPTRQAINEGFQHSTLEQNNGRVVIDSGASGSASRNDVVPSRAAS